jgi:MFS family permease
MEPEKTTKSLRERVRAKDPAFSLRSRFALNAVNFFLAQLTGIGSPFLADLLLERRWDYDEIGVAASMSGLGVLLVQTPVGVLVDRFTRPRRLLAVAAVAVGAAYAVLPLIPEDLHVLTETALFVSGLVQSFFAPLLAGLALGLAGHRKLNRVIGMNQAWNNLGTVTAASIALALVGRDMAPAFYLIGVIGCLAALSGLAIRRDEVDRARARGGQECQTSLGQLVRDERVIVLLAATALFQVADSAALPFAALRVKDLGGTNAEVAALVIVSQATMAPVALLAGRLCERWGRKPVFAIGFVAEPLRVLLCALVPKVGALIAFQVLGGVAAGIFGVALVLVTADLARGTGCFHGLTGASRTVLALASVVGPLLAGFILSRGSYSSAFGALAALAAAGAAVFVARMPETRAT